MFILCEYKLDVEYLNSILLSYKSISSFQLLFHSWTENQQASLRSSGVTPAWWQHRQMLGAKTCCHLTEPGQPRLPYTQPPRRGRRSEQEVLTSRKTNEETHLRSNTGRGRCRRPDWRRTGLASRASRASTAARGL